MDNHGYMKEIFLSNNIGKHEQGEKKNHKERDVNAFAGVKSPQSKVNKPNETTVIKTEMLFGKKPLPCKATDRIRRKEESLK